MSRPQRDSKIRALEITIGIQNNDDEDEDISSSEEENDEIEVMQEGENVFENGMVDDDGLDDEIVYWPSDEEESDTSDEMFDEVSPDGTKWKKAYLSSRLDVSQDKTYSMASQGLSNLEYTQKMKWMLV